MQHGSKSSGPTVPEPSHAERARSLVRQGGASTLSTMSARRPGFPFGSVMPYAEDEHGEPLLLISSMAMHTQNLLADPRCTLLICESGDGDILGRGRVSLMGEARQVEGDAIPAAREQYLAAQAAAAQWIEYSDFQLFRISLIDIYFVGGFGVMGWVAAEEYRQAEPDPLLDSAQHIIQHMNEDHADALTLLANTHGYADVEAAAMTSVDRLGFHVKLRTNEGQRGGRINFPASVADADGCRQALVAMVKQARGEAGS